MRSHSITVALSDLDKIEKEAAIRLRRARRILEKRSSRALFIRDNIGHCDFAGYLLVTVVDRKSEAAVFIQDADDWGLELVVQDVSSAEQIFDNLFKTRPEFDKAFEDELRLYGFVNI